MEKAQTKNEKIELSVDKDAFYQMVEEIVKKELRQMDFSEITTHDFNIRVDGKKVFEGLKKYLKEDSNRYGSIDPNKIVSKTVEKEQTKDDKAELSVDKDIFYQELEKIVKRELRQMDFSKITNQNFTFGFDGKYIINAIKNYRDLESKRNGSVNPNKVR